jgi:hypothetical protein
MPDPITDSGLSFGATAVSTPRPLRSCKAISYGIINAGGFLGLTKHNVAVPVSQFKLVDKKLVLPGATKDALKASPEHDWHERPPTSASSPSLLDWRGE